MFFVGLSEEAKEADGSDAKGRSFTTAKQPLKKNYVEYLLRLP